MFNLKKIVKVIGYAGAIGAVSINLYVLIVQSINKTGVFCWYEPNPYIRTFEILMYVFISVCLIVMLIKWIMRLSKRKVYHYP